jgi:hypothetical protein|tara:strand:+ start:306 stop:716 length:411 start_codon:yes stop_codon:yes gene_type:complete
MDKLDRIVETACYVGDISLKEFNSKCRDRHLIDIKRMVYSLAKELLGMRYLHIAQHFKVNHATVMHHCKLHRNLIEVDAFYFRKYKTILEIVKSDLNTIEIDELMDVVARLRANKESQIELKQRLHNYYQSTENEN